MFVCEGKEVAVLLDGELRTGRVDTVGPGRKDCWVKLDPKKGRLYCGMVFVSADQCTLPRKRQSRVVAGPKTF